MNIQDKLLDYSNKSVKSRIEIQISGSKSESNRLLVLQQIFPNITLENVSDSDDTVHLANALMNEGDLIDIGHAGTAMRFLTAYYASMPGRTLVLTGSSRMQQRPIRILVDALKQLGAEIHYEINEGYPPLRICGKELLKNSVQIAGNVSSQYLSALLLIAPRLKNGLKLLLTEKCTSRPYLEMTLTLLNSLGVKTYFENQTIQIKPTLNIEPSTWTIESDWSSASYFYSMAALSPVDTEYYLTYYKEDSLQGDRCLVDIYRQLGVDTVFENGGITLRKTNRTPVLKELDLQDAPDIAQTIVVTCFALQIPCHLTGLHTLKIKETDRLVALKNELTKLGAKIHVTDTSLHLEAASQIYSNCFIETYDDHRMAMAFAPLAMKVPIVIKDAAVVTKSFRDFWENFANCFK
ncbi:3-phosphoshikimate 1-carboxyvinyltransferase [Flavobacteriaceae bacterium F08102]|nr:3-phosphoshikimate 1-carboxyvinyltransferase [Flavobacteriaceae bacterium F08102]